MMIIATAPSPLILALGIAIAGVVPSLSYTPISALIVNLVREKNKKKVYSIINSGTSLGVAISAPVVIYFADEWRYAWVGFSLLALIVTLWCAVKIPAIPISPKASGIKSISLKALFLNGFTRYKRRKVLLVSFFIGISTSVYWTFWVDLISTSSQGELYILETYYTRDLIAKLFWVLVGLAGFFGVFAGNSIDYLGVNKSMLLFQFGIALSIALLASLNHVVAIIFSAVTFGACFVFTAATLGIWSMKVFNDLPSVGFGLVFLSLSAGQFVGPLCRLTYNAKRGMVST